MYYNNITILYYKVILFYYFCSNIFKKLDYVRIVTKNVSFSIFLFINFFTTNSNTPLRGTLEPVKIVNGNSAKSTSPIESSLEIKSPSDVPLNLFVQLFSLFLPIQTHHAKLALLIYSLNFLQQMPN